MTNEFRKGILDIRIYCIPMYLDLPLMKKNDEEGSILHLVPV